MLYKIGNKIINIESVDGIVHYLMKQNNDCTESELFKIYQERLGREPQEISRKRFLQLIFYYESIYPVYRVLFTPESNTGDILTQKKLIREENNIDEDILYRVIIVKLVDFNELTILNPDKRMIYSIEHSGYYLK